MHEVACCGDTGLLLALPGKDHSQGRQYEDPPGTCAGLHFVTMMKYQRQVLYEG